MYPFAWNQLVAEHTWILKFLNIIKLVSKSYILAMDFQLIWGGLLPLKYHFSIPSFTRRIRRRDWVRVCNNPTAILVTIALFVSLSRLGLGTKNQGLRGQKILKKTWIFYGLFENKEILNGSQNVRRPPYCSTQHVETSILYTWSPEVLESRTGNPVSRALRFSCQGPVS